MIHSVSIRLLVTLCAIVATPTIALAHGDEEHVEPAATPSPPAPVDEVERLRITLDMPREAEVGGTATVRATVTHRDDGDPVEGAVVTFLTDATWGEAIAGPVVLGTAPTDLDGIAVLTMSVRSAGDLEVVARVEESQDARGATATTTLDVAGERQVVADEVGLRIPWLNLWMLAAVIGLVWLLFLLAARHLSAIAREPEAVLPDGTSGTVSRRKVLRRVVPVSVQAGIAAIGIGLVGVVARSPRTHGNLLDPPGTEAYERTPVAFVGRFESMREMPPALDRHVSFREDVLPIFMRFGGPHVVQPENSPPPGGLRLDTWEHVIESGVVVPGRPEESELVEHLLSPAMQMPPSRPPLPDESISLIVTWIAQGAEND